MLGTLGIHLTGPKRDLSILCGPLGVGYLKVPEAEGC